MATANMKDIKRRIKSVESTMQITKAMELVASSKLRKAKQRAEKAQPYFTAVYETMCKIAQDTAFTSIYTKDAKARCTLLIVIAGDRGLAGGFNSNILKMAEARAVELKKDSEVKIMPIGKKAVDYFMKRDYEVLESYSNIGEDINIYDSQDIVDKVIEEFSQKKIGGVELFYTTFQSALSQIPQAVKVLPVDLKAIKTNERSATIYEPSAEAVFDGVIPKYLIGIVYGAIVDSFAAEQAARRMAMESASDNAGDMISSLSLIYNRARQATITQEITEIVAGSKANK